MTDEPIIYEVYRDKCDRLSDEMYLELKSLGSDCEEREDIQDAYWCELDDILNNCLNKH